VIILQRAAALWYYKQPKIKIEERYPIFPTGIGHPQLLKFRKREHLSQRKDKGAWKRYRRKDVRLAYLRGEFPTIWISLPEQGKIDVKISIYDSAGNISEPVELNYCPTGSKSIKDRNLRQ